MKLIAVSIFLCFSLLFFAQKNIYPGMHIKDFRKEIPNRIPPTLPFNETFTLEEEINTVKGKWVMEFRNNRLKMVKFRSEAHYLGWPVDKDEEKNKKLLEKSRADAQKVFDHYRQKYGAPSNGATIEFKLDPEKSNYSEILTSEQWELSGMKLIVDHKFEGDNPEMMNLNNSELTMYHYVVEISVLPGKRGMDEHKEKFFIGMDIKDFAKNFPQLMPYGVLEWGQSGFTEIIHGLDGKWFFDFENDTLENYSYSKYFNEYDELTEENFKKCLEATEQLIKDYTNVYGEPTELIVGDTAYKDPSKEKHWGYDVIEARWINDQQKFKIDFQFSGGKGVYFYLVRIEAYKPDYEYF
jgi:hypothetical protein